MKAPLDYVPIPTSCSYEPQTPNPLEKPFE